MRPAVIHAEAHAQHVCLTLGQRAEDLGQRFGEHRVGRGVDGAGGIVVLDEGADGRILLVADRHVQRQGVGGGAIGLDDLLDGQIQLSGDLLERRLAAQLLQGGVFRHKADFFVACVRPYTQPQASGCGDPPKGVCCL